MTEDYVGAGEFQVPDEAGGVHTILIDHYRRCEPWMDFSLPYDQECIIGTRMWLLPEWGGLELFTPRSVAEVRALHRRAWQLALAQAPHGSVFKNQV